MKTALLSVNDKKNIKTFASGLIACGYTIISTGGTGTYLQDCGIDITTVESFTGFSEIMDGRVKTLHPAIFAGILSRRDNPNDSADVQTIGSSLIDIVVVNLYPFASVVSNKNTSLEIALEHIDIGGVSLLRAAAKNYKDVLALCDPNDYAQALIYLEEMAKIQAQAQAQIQSKSKSQAQTQSKTQEQIQTKDSITIAKRYEHYRLLQAKKIFDYTTRYDAHINTYFQKQAILDKGKKKIRKALQSTQIFPDILSLHYTKQRDLRYGENPHQKAALYIPIQSSSQAILYGAKQLHGKQLSYNNVRDAQSALAIMQTQLTVAENIPTQDKIAHLIQGKQKQQDLNKEYFVAVGVKHSNPCAVAKAESTEQAWDTVYAADPVSIFGGIVVLSGTVESSLALKLSKLFLEIIIAPKFTEEALQILQKKKNIRLLKISLRKIVNNAPVEYISFGTALLVQQVDTLQNAISFSQSLQCVTQKNPSYEQLQALLFAWAAVKHVKSNAIVLAQKQQTCVSTVSIGAGQMNRLEATNIALLHSLNKQGKVRKGLVLASDAFFPMRDSIDLAATYNVSAIIQPGGSIRDQDSIDACNEHGISMLFTHTRHFLH